MDEKILDQALAALKLTKNTSSLYKISYKSGRMSVGQLAEAAGMDRSSAYLACDQLSAAGLLIKENTGGRSKVWVKHPKEILSHLRANVRSLRSNYDKLEEVLPQLDARYQEKHNQPILQTFTGSHGLRLMEQHVLEHAVGEILLLTNQREERKVFSKVDHEHFIRERLKKNLRIRVLATYTQEALDMQKKDHEFMRETKIISDLPEPFKSETYIYGDYVAMLSFNEEVIGILIKSSEFTEPQRWLFEKVWQQC